MTLLLAFGQILPALAGQPLRMDSSKLEVRNFEKGHLDTYRSQKAFNYTQQKPAELSWWERFKMWLAMKVAELLLLLIGFTTPLFILMKFYFTRILKKC
jgi:hypothetical protein